MKEGPELHPVESETEEKIRQKADGERCFN